MTRAKVSGRARAKKGKESMVKVKMAKGSIPRARTNLVVSMAKEKEKTRVQTMAKGRI